MQLARLCNAVPANLQRIRSQKLVRARNSTKRDEID
jgi:hypothetical protein